MKLSLFATDIVVYLETKDVLVIAMAYERGGSGRM